MKAMQPWATQQKRKQQEMGHERRKPGEYLVVGVDVGGTFTDLFVLDEASGRASIVKVPSTRGEESRGS